MIGKVIWFDAKKGFGFIQQQENQDIFVHFSDIIGKGYRELKQNQKVSYSIGQNYSGQPKAIQVEVIYQPTSKNENY